MGPDFVPFLICLFIVLRIWWKSNQEIDDGRNTVGNRFSKKKRNRKITDEELITVVFPTILNDK